MGDVTIASLTLGWRTKWEPDWLRWRHPGSATHGGALGGSVSCDFSLKSEL